MVNSNLGPISHRLATKHSWRTDERTDGRMDDDNRDKSLTVTKIR